MTVPSSLTHTKTHVRCRSDWGTPLSGFSESEWGRCRHAFREHCIKRLGLDTGPD
jgi:hypothetical protein